MTVKIKLARANGALVSYPASAPTIVTGSSIQINTANGLQPSQDKVLYKIKDTNFDVIHLFDDNLIEHFNRLYPSTTIINNQYIDGLFVNDVVENPIVKKTLQMTCDLNQFKESGYINNILKIYEEAL